MRYARYRGLLKTHLQHLGTAAAINLQRIASWLMGDLPKGTRISPFAPWFHQFDFANKVENGRYPRYTHLEQTSSFLFSLPAPKLSVFCAPKVSESRH